MVVHARAKLSKYLMFAGCEAEESGTTKAGAALASTMAVGAGSFFFFLDLFGDMATKRRASREPHTKA